MSASLRSRPNLRGIQILHATTEREFDTVFATLRPLGAGALVIGPDSLFISRSAHLGALTLRHAVPAISPYREFATAGGLMSYGTDIPKLYRQVGFYTTRILQGEKPGELPVQQAVNVELVINLKTARSLGLEVPRTLIARADEVIE